jgi:rhomboid protease GluP
LVGATEERCPFCGAWRPGMFGYGPWLQRTFGNVDLSNVITALCVVLYVLSLALDPRAALQMRGLWDILSPSSSAIFRLGATGTAVMVFGQWWTVFTACFLHGSLLHLAFNMVIMRRYLPMLEHLFGTARTLIIFMVAGVVGYLASNLMHIAFTVGASGAIFGIFGALISYGRRTGQSQVTQQLMTSAVVMFASGFIIPSVNIWAHAGGFAGGFVAAELMPTSGRNDGAFTWILAGLCVLITLAGFVLSFIGYAPAGVGG